MMFVDLRRSSVDSLFQTWSVNKDICAIILDSKQNCYSNNLDAKKNFCSKHFGIEERPIILDLKQNCCSKNLDAKQEFCANNFGIKSVFLHLSF